MSAQHGNEGARISIKYIAFWASGYFCVSRHPRSHGVCSLPDVLTDLPVKEGSVLVCVCTFSRAGPTSEEMGSALVATPQGMAHHFTRREGSLARSHLERC